MKPLYLLLTVFIYIGSSAQFNFHAGYALSMPGKDMGENINPLHSFTTGVAYRLPRCLERVQAGLDMSIGTYAYTTKEQTFTFNNGTSTVTDVNYSSNVFQLNASGKIFMFPQAMFNPYASGKLGYASYYSNIFIEDPTDPGGCKALDQKNLIKDGTLMGGYGAGLQVDWSLFSSKWSKGSRFLDISVSNNSGGRVDYINTKKLIDASNPPTGTDGKPLYVKFINATTQQIHEHQVAEVYNSPMRMLEFRVSSVFTFGNCK